MCVWLSVEGGSICCVLLCVEGSCVFQARGESACVRCVEGSCGCVWVCVCGC